MYIHFFFNKTSIWKSSIAIMHTKIGQRIYKKYMEHIYGNTKYIKFKDYS